jgi:hypothetical protein
MKRLKGLLTTGYMSNQSLRQLFEKGPNLRSIILLMLIGLFLNPPTAQTALLLSCGIVLFESKFNSITTDKKRSKKDKQTHLCSACQKECSSKKDKSQIDLKKNRQ